MICGSRGNAALLPLYTERLHGWVRVRSTVILASDLHLAKNTEYLVLGPIVGGWVSQSRLGWRFTFWIMFIVSAMNALACLFITPETVSMLLPCLVPPRIYQKVSVAQLEFPSVVWPCAPPEASTQADKVKWGRLYIYLEARHQSFPVFH